MRKVLVLFAICLGMQSLAQDELVSVLGQRFPAFAMQSVNAGNVNMSDEHYQFVALVFVCNHCPMAKLYWDRINEMYSTYLPKQVLVVAVNPMDSLVYKEESAKEMKKRCKASRLQVPYVQDGNQFISASLKVPHTPYVVVLSREQENWKVVYEGAFDDNGANPKLATPYLANALNELIQGKPLTVSQTPSFGCRVYYREPNGK